MIVNVVLAFRRGYPAAGSDHHSDEAIWPLLDIVYRRRRQMDLTVRWWVAAS
jgi:hypothetical protein